MDDGVHVSTEPSASGADGNPTLDTAEVRVLGVLIEKAATTPDQYPLTLNSLRLGCNQSSSRDPVVDYDDATVEAALMKLRERGLIRIVHSRSNRGAKYRHVADEVFELAPGELAVLDVLMLRGAQTVGQLKQRADRQHSFDDLDATEVSLNDLAGRRLARQLPRQRGQNEARWVHLLSGEPTTDEAAPATDAAPESQWSHTPPGAIRDTPPSSTDQATSTSDTAATRQMVRQVVRSGSDLEERFGSSRAVRVGAHVYVGATSPSARSLDDDAGVQATDVLETIELALGELGASMGDVVRTVVYCADPSDVDLIARAHRSALADATPATTLVMVARFDAAPGCRVQIEATAVTPSP